MVVPAPPVGYLRAAPPPPPPLRISGAGGRPVVVVGTHAPSSHGGPGVAPPRIVLGGADRNTLPERSPAASGAFPYIYMYMYN